MTDRATRKAYSAAIQRLREAFPEPPIAAPHATAEDHRKALDAVKAMTARAWARFEDTGSADADPWRAAIVRAALDQTANRDDTAT